MNRHASLRPAPNPSLDYRFKGSRGHIKQFLSGTDPEGQEITLLSSLLIDCSLKIWANGFDPQGQTIGSNRLPLVDVRLASLVFFAVQQLNWVTIVNIGA